jgi:type IV pilus assembly protein PilV
MKHTVKITRRASFVQRGITLLEALVAMLVLAFGVLGLAVIQGRMLVETRATNARAEAIRLIADLGERVRFNYLGQSLPIANSSPLYVMNPTDAFKSPTPNVPLDANCGPASSSSCTPANQAKYDVWDWRTEIASALPGGVANITAVPATQQLKVVVAWLANENTNATLSGVAPDSKTAAAYQQLSAPLQITFDGNDPNPCALNNNAQTQQTAVYICHVDFINLPQVN